MNRDYVIGIDGGGTRSRGVAMGMNGECLRRVESGALNFNTIPPDEFLRHLTQLFEGLFAKPSLGRCVRAVIGTAALFHEATVDEKAAVLRGVDLGSIEEVSVVGDGVTAVSGAAGGEEATLVIAGTGSIVVRQTRDGRVAFAGGLGPLIGGDPGSAFWMACEAIKEVQRQFCLRGELCPMGKFLCDYFGVPGLYDLVSEVHRDPAGRKKLAASAQLLSESSQSDILEPWSHIEERAGQGLACLVGDLFPSPSGMSEEIFVSGSVLLKNERVKKALNLALNTKGKIIVRLQEPQYDAAMGAGFIALRQIQSGPMEDERR